MKLAKLNLINKYLRCPMGVSTLDLWHLVFLPYHTCLGLPRLFISDVDF